MKRKVLAVCTSWEDAENLNLVLKSLIEVAEPRNVLPMCVTFDRSGVESRGEESIQELVTIFDAADIVGVLLFGEMIRSDDINEKIIALAKRKKLPVFMLERQYEGCINLPFAYSEGFEEMARHMIVDHGCRNVVVLAGIKGNSFSEERIDICRRILAERGVELSQEQIIYGDFWDEPTYKALDQYFSSGGAVPEAFICINDAMAISVSVYLSERDIRVPDQVLVGGFDGILQGEQHEPTITTSRPDFEYMFNLMLDRTESWKPEMAGKTESCVIPFHFLRRESCGCVKREHGEFLYTQKIGELKMINLDFSRHIRGLGKFIRGTLSMDSIDKLTECLPPFFSQWGCPYYFAAVIDEKDRGLALPILHGIHGKFDEGEDFSWRERPVPDMDAVLSDSDIRILMVQLLQNQDETMGYIISGINDWTFRSQERFEEEALFLSAALNAVVRNRRLKEANDAILSMAEHDSLTGLYNRLGFRHELERLLTAPEYQDKILTLFSMDMDRLKHINDVYGHQEGDNAIQSLARGIRDAAEGKGICARYGGDEFAFALFTDEALDFRAEEIREKIERVARQESANREYLVSASIGASSSPVLNHRPLEELFLEADQKLYRDKEQRKMMRNEK